MYKYACFCVKILASKLSKRAALIAIVILVLIVAFIAVGLCYLTIFIIEIIFANFQLMTRLVDIFSNGDGLNDGGFNYCDIIISSSTILGLFGVGSFLIVGTKTNKPGKLHMYNKIILFPIFIVELSHIVLITNVVLGIFNSDLFGIVILVTIECTFSVMTCMWKTSELVLDIATIKNTRN